MLNLGSILIPTIFSCIKMLYDILSILNSPTPIKQNNCKYLASIT